MKKALKIISVCIMILGILFSILNFISIELNANGMMGVWIYNQTGERICDGNGSECSIEIELP